MNGDDVMGGLTAVLLECRRRQGYAVQSEVAALLPVVDAIAKERAAEALVAAYWATAAIPDPESVREVILARADALQGER